jgi:hypothetical protein
MILLHSRAIQRTSSTCSGEPDTMAPPSSVAVLCKKLQPDTLKLAADSAIKAPPFPAELPTKVVCVRGRGHTG